MRHQLIYMLESAWGHIRRDWVRFLAGIMIPGLVLAVAGLWSGLYTSFADQWTDLTTVECLVYLKDDISREKAAELMDSVWKSGPDMKWTFISREKDIQENRVLLQKLAPGIATNDVGAAHLRIDARIKSPSDLSNLQDRISRLSSIRGVDFVIAPPLSGNGVGISWVVGGMQTVGWIAIILMFLVAVFVVSSRMRWIMRDKKIEVDVVRYFGGTDSFYRIPVLIEGLVGGTLAGLTGFLLAWLGWSFTVGIIWSTYSVDLAMHGVPITTFFWISLGGPVGGVMAFILSVVMERW